jgi:hypothetical protein
LRRHPVVVRAGVAAVGGAHESQVLDPRHIGRIGAVQEAPREIGLIEWQQSPRCDQLTLDGSALNFTSIAPMDFIGLGEPGDFLDPSGHVAIQGG